MARMSEMECGRALQMLEEGVSQRRVAEILGKSPSVINRLVQRERQTGSASYRHGGGRERSTTHREDQEIVREARRRPRATATELREVVPRPVSSELIRRRLHDAELRSRRPSVKPALTPRHKDQRVVFARFHQEWTMAQWDRCLFTDESKIVLHSNCGRERVWRRAGERYRSDLLNRSRAFGGGSVTVWAGVSSTSRTDIVIFRNQTVNAKIYIDSILRPIVVPEAARIGNGFHLVDDNAPAHRAGIVNEFLHEEDIDRLFWPANSPDLNPIENVWALLKQRVRDRRPYPATLVDLEVAVREEWALIPQHQIAAAIRSMPRRCAAVIRRRGEALKY